MKAEILVTSSDYDAKFAALIAELDQCGYSDTADCDSCAVRPECQRLFDSLCDLRTHYRISQDDYDKFMQHFKNLSKQLTFC